MAVLLFIQSMMASQQHTATHYLISFRVTILSCLMRYIFEARLTKDVTGEYCTRLYVPLLQEYLQVACKTNVAILYKLVCDGTPTGFDSAARSAANRQLKTPSKPFTPC